MTHPTPHIPHYTSSILHHQSSIINHQNTARASVLSFWLTNALRYTYSVGVFRSFNEALLQLNPVRSLGFPDAEIVAYLDGKPVSVSLARRSETTPTP